ncbi:uncharacterized protein SPPG_01787 [Spizellomyces punctatus DAOM BR117]|uniref:Restriction of telomere capping protein 4 n=1 Tax=Spizellomyces punctatus (strain DAOM BR117) TaxID=645134 RepID=A0A0L0HPI1_SPIPD|nr:uncharacterized protein SPPG_01787 [Spizellomyces punctatus DAOM BR117]KND02704.1 hypothetical protein SPPG_01787 [Spizellomyces punctatus DAOM BR117]|eukprot:XP_016610743.1 hypothetical protein SPPG_01787 [Spizellomyces punctatus DAOM BR117]
MTGVNEGRVSCIAVICDEVLLPCADHRRSLLYYTRRRHIQYVTCEQCSTMKAKSRYSMTRTWNRSESALHHKQQLMDPNANDSSDDGGDFPAAEDALLELFDTSSPRDRCAGPSSDEVSSVVKKESKISMAHALESREGCNTSIFPSPGRHLKVVAGVATGTGTCKLSKSPSLSTARRTRQTTECERSSPSITEGEQYFRRKGTLESTSSASAHVRAKERGYLERAPCSGNTTGNNSEASLGSSLVHNYEISVPRTGRVSEFYEPIPHVMSNQSAPACTTVGSVQEGGLQHRNTSLSLDMSRVNRVYRGSSRTRVHRRESPVKNISSASDAQGSEIAAAIEKVANIRSNPPWKISYTAKIAGRVKTIETSASTGKAGKSVQNQTGCFLKLFEARIRLPSPIKERRRASGDWDIEDSGDERKEEEGLRCPQCLRVLSLPLSLSVGRQFYKLRESEVVRDDEIVIRDPIALYEFCRTHTAEDDIIPAGLAMGYPREIDFKNTRRRVRQMFADLLRIIEGREESYYRQLALALYKELGTRKAQGVRYKMNTMKGISCGYYGKTGARVIMKTIYDMFVGTAGKTPYLTARMTAPQPIIEYIQDVLVPEAAIRLIMDDCTIHDKRQARDILTASSDFGSVMFPDSDDEHSDADEEPDLLHSPRVASGITNSDTLFVSSPEMTEEERLTPDGTSQDLTGEWSTDYDSIIWVV